MPMRTMSVLTSGLKKVAAEPPVGAAQAARYIQIANEQMGGSDGVAADWSKRHPGAVMPSEVMQFFQRRAAPGPQFEYGLGEQYLDHAKDLGSRVSGNLSVIGDNIGDAASAAGSAITSGARTAGGAFASGAGAAVDAAKGLFRGSTPPEGGIGAALRNNAGLIAAGGATALLAGLLTYNLLKKKRVSRA